MEIKIDYSFGGKKFDSLTQAVNAAMEEGVKDLIREKLSAFQPQLTNSVITVKPTTTNGTLQNYSIQVSNVPDDIKEQVEQALSR